MLNGSKNPLQLFSYFNNILIIIYVITSDERHCKTRRSGLGGNQSLVYAFTQILLLSLQCCHVFEIIKLACNIIWFYVHYIEHVKCFENNITPLQDKFTDVNIFALSLKIWTVQREQNRKRNIFFSEKTIKFLYIHFLALSTVPDGC